MRHALRAHLIVAYPPSAANKSAVAGTDMRSSLIILVALYLTACSWMTCPPLDKSGCPTYNPYRCVPNVEGKGTICGCGYWLMGRVLRSILFFVDLNSSPRHLMGWQFFQWLPSKEKSTAGKTVRQPTLLYTNMTLQEILYGTWLPPENTKTRRNIVGMTEGARYEEPKKRFYKTIDGLGRTEHKVYCELQRHKKPISANELGELLGMTRENCSIVLTSLHKKGITERRKVENGSVRFYVYKAKIWQQN